MGEDCILDPLDPNIPLECDYAAEGPDWCWGFDNGDWIIFIDPDETMDEDCGWCF
jgi:hypothetical protein